MSRHEKPLKGNKRQLVINQHVLPRASIARFAKADGFVSLFDIARGKKRPAHPKDKVFCAMRAWDQRAESGYMKRIEDPFQNLAEDIIAGSVPIITDAHKPIIDRFYALWYMRARFRRLPEQEIQVNGVTGGGITKVQEENLEANFTMFHREGGKIPARFINGIQLQMRIDQYVASMLAAMKWAIMQAQEGEFLVPDVPFCTMVPLIPMACLMASCDENGTLPKENVAQVNRMTWDLSKDYVFARSFAACPPAGMVRARVTPPPQLIEIPIA